MTGPPEPDKSDRNPKAFRRLLAAIDLHIPWMLLLLSFGICIGSWWLAVVALVPQGTIYTRSPARGPHYLRYWLANEALVLFVCLVLCSLRYAVLQILPRN